MRLCGFFNFDPAVAWALTPGEFEDYVSGGVDRVREHRICLARIESAVLGFGGVRVSPLVLIGEDDGEDSEDDPFFKEDKLARRQEKFAEMRRRAAESEEAEHRAWLAGIVGTREPDDS